MNKPPILPRFIMVGGFLGAGKTTTISALAAHYQSCGKRVAIVTNDQACDLVDTLLLQEQKFDVGEVAGACFCCRFNELTSTVERFGQQERPDIILAEPVGSCTDLVATVIKPLESIYGHSLDIAPYGVIIKPSHGLKILRGDSEGGFSPKAEYIFRKQIEEADYLVLNHVDALSIGEVREITELLANAYPSVPVVQMSAKTKVGFAMLVEMIEQLGVFGRRVMEVDYDIYAEGEAELGWVNCQIDVDSDHAIRIDEFLVDLLERMRSALVLLTSEIAHLKIIGLAQGLHAVVNLVSNSSNVELSIASRGESKSMKLVVNARVAISPEKLRHVVTFSILASAQAAEVHAAISKMQSKRPGRPIPTHRMN